MHLQQGKPETEMRGREVEIVNALKLHQKTF